MADVSALLDHWGNFYVIIGSSSAALTGLMFVAITLMPEARGRVPGVDLGVLTFNSPTVVHLCTAFLISALLSVPWPDPVYLAWAIGLTGLAGLIYGWIVVRRMHRMEKETAYHLVFEDWLWHTILPNIAYGVAGLAGMLLRRYMVGSLFAIAVAALVLLFASIHNAWDIVTYITTHGFPERRAESPAEIAPPGAAAPPEAERPQRFGSDSWSPPPA